MIGASVLAGGGGFLVCLLPLTWGRRYSRASPRVLLHLVLLVLAPVPPAPPREMRRG